MNALQKYILLTKRDEQDVLSTLQGGSNCPISDLCAQAVDVHPADAEKAVVRLTGRTYEKYYQWFTSGNQSHE